MVKNKKGEASLGVIILTFIGIIVAIALLVPIFDTQAQMTTLQSAVETTNLSANGCSLVVVGGAEVNESVAACNLTAGAWYPTGDWRILDGQCALSSVVVANAAGDALVLDTDYELFASTGIIRMLNTTSTNESALGFNVVANYDYCAEGYNTSGSSRTMATLIGLFAALALMAFSLEWMGVTNFLDR